MTSIAQKRSSWADDDWSVGSGPPIGGGASAPSDAGSRHSEPKFKVWYKKHPTTYAKILYDVEGRALVDEDGNTVNIFTVKMKDMLEKGTIVCHHKPGRPGYRYFSTYNTQADLFKKARQKGMSNFVGPFHVYPDECGCVLPFEEGTCTAL
jgi:hypothetical protein